MRKLIVRMLDPVISYESRPAVGHALMSPLDSSISKKHTAAGRPRHTVPRVPSAIKHAFPTANKLAI
ncbi:hypothetical protein LJR034_002021 [Caballeronia sp. LjRoot34]|uniref:hypothetical protein n=1 Tax=Caballeronia sp. LjRoot34 TaxID=3342325 RepID=UPI003ED1643C